MKWTESVINIQSDKAAKIKGLRTDLQKNMENTAAAL